MILSHFLGQTMFTPNVIPNKLTEKSNKKRPGKKLGCAFCISVEYKIKDFFFFFGKYQIYFISCGEIAAFSLVPRALEKY